MEKAIPVYRYFLRKNEMAWYYNCLKNPFEFKRLFIMH